MTGHLDLTSWSFEPSVTAGLVAVVAAYVVAMRRGVLAATDDVSPWMGSPRLRPVWFGLGVAAGFLALDSPIDVGGDQYLFWLHMLQHIVLMMVAPPLVLLGIAGVRPPTGMSPRLRRVWSAVTRPWPAVVLFNAVLVLWHVPALYDATLTTEPIHIVEHLTFIAVGVVFWWPVVDPMRTSTAREPLSPFTKIALLVVAGIPPTVLGLVFALARSPFYDFYARAPRLWGMSAVADQQVAGVVMFGLGNIIYFVAVSIVFLRLFGDPEADEQDVGEEAAPHAAG